MSDATQQQSIESAPAAATSPVVAASAPRSDYRVELDNYNGPLELLLYLIKKEEVDIHDIPIARITQQYLAHVELIRRIDINLAGDFLVMAATLMEIKSRMLAPRPPAEPGEIAGSVEDLADPRQQLVQQLLAYKQYKDAADDLRRRSSAEQQRFPRAVRRVAGKAPLDLDDLNLFLLIDSFNAIMASVGHSAFGHEVTLDDTPISLHQADILDRLSREGPVALQEMFAGRKNRGEMIGLFLAMLELIRLKQLRVEQPEALGPLMLSLAPPGETPSTLSAEQPAAGGAADAGPPAENGAPPNTGAMADATAPAGITDATLQ
ncbi:MAG: segregation/condensation protein A [Phycisphaerales bacterium]|nr:segregation/condensation protein A [Phycisphaerales bacterium]